MGTAGTSSDETPVPRTRCSRCGTAFEISPELLASTDTRVRCGECFSIFDALANLLEPGESAPLGAVPPSSPGEVDGTNAAGTDAASPDAAREVLSRPADDADAYADDDALDVTYSDFDLFSGDAELPEVAYLDETADTAEFELDALADPESEGDAADGAADEVANEPEGGGEPMRASHAEPSGEVASGPPAARPALAGGDAPDDTAAENPPPTDGAVPAETPSPPPSEPIASTATGFVPEVPPPFVAPSPSPPIAALEEPIDHPPGRRGSWVLRTVLVLTLVSLLVGLYLHRERDRLHNDPLGRPLLTLACAISGCEVPSRVDLAGLALLGKEVFTHPSVEGALVINVAFRNTAEFAQRYPVMVVRLRDRVGRSVAEFDFPPADYLDDWSPGDTLAAGRRLDITLEVDDPGEGAESYEFEFREADA